MKKKDHTQSGDEIQEIEVSDPNGNVSPKTRRIRPEKSKQKKSEEGLRINGGILFLAAAILVIVTVFVTFLVADSIYFGGYFLNKSNKVSFHDEKADLYKIAKYQDILNFIESDFCLEYDINDLIEGAIEGMIQALGDPYSAYYKPGAMDDYLEYITGNYQGIGIEIRETESVYQIMTVYADSPAEKAGLKAGDVITAINGTPVAELTEEEEKVLHTEGASVVLTVKDETAEKNVTVVVEKINRQAVFTKTYDNGIKYIRIKQFDDDAGTEFQNAITQTLQEGCRGIVLDLRNNGGGYEKEATKVADILLPKGEIAHAEDKNGTVISRIESDENEIELPIVMLINQNTASASELVAGAFRDFHKGTIVGVKSYGKALGQLSKTYTSDGSGVVITTARYFTPSGECIHGIGITPDVVLALEEAYRDMDQDDIPEGCDVQLLEALRILQEQI